jgi:hypothetical protein
MLNAFNHANFTPVSGIGNTTLSSYQITTALSGTNTSEPSSWSSGSTGNADSDEKRGGATCAALFCVRQAWLAAPLALSR